MFDKLSQEAASLAQYAFAKKAEQQQDLESQSTTNFFSSISSTLAGNSTVNDASNWFNNLLGRETAIPAEPSSFFGGMCTLTRTQRFWGFLMSIAAGILCLFLSAMYLPTILFSSRNFAFLYTMGNLLLFGSVSFLVGPVQQLKSMLDEHRRVPSLVFICSAVLSLFAALQLFNIAIVMFLTMVQVISASWYLLTYIPMGQRMVGWMYSAFRSMF